MAKMTTDEARKRLDEARARANAAKTSTEKIAALTEVRAWTMTVRKKELEVVERATIKAKIEDKKTRGARSHFLFVVAGELFKKAKTDQPTRTLIASLVAAIESPKEKGKAKPMLEYYQAEWMKPAKPVPTPPKPAQAGPAQPQPRR